VKFRKKLAQLMMEPKTWMQIHLIYPGKISKKLFKKKEIKACLLSLLQRQSNQKDKPKPRLRLIRL